MANITKPATIPANLDLPKDMILPPCKILTGTLNPVEPRAIGHGFPTRAAAKESHKLTGNTPFGTVMPARIRATAESATRSALYVKRTGALAASAC